VEGHAAHHATWGGAQPETPETKMNRDSLDQWTEVHRQVEELEDGDRALFDLFVVAGLDPGRGRRCARGRREDGQPPLRRRAAAPQ
jgi:hypothetical protein